MQSKIEKIDPDKKYRRVLAASTLAGDSVRNSVGEDLGKLDENDRHPVRQGNRDLGVRCYENDVEVLVQLRTRVRPGDLFELDPLLTGTAGQVLGDHHVTFAHVIQGVIGGDSRTEF